MTCWQRTNQTSSRTPLFSPSRAGEDRVRLPRETRLDDALDVATSDSAAIDIASGTDAMLDGNSSWGLPSALQRLQDCALIAELAPSVDPRRYQYVPRARVLPAERGFVPEVAAALSVRLLRAENSRSMCVPVTIRNTEDRRLSTVMFPTLRCGETHFGWGLHGYYSHSSSETEVQISDAFVADRGLQYASIGAPIRIEIAPRARTISGVGRVVTAFGLFSFDLRRWFRSTEACNRALESWSQQANPARMVRSAR